MNPFHFHSDHIRSSRMPTLEHHPGQPTRDLCKSKGSLWQYRAITVRFKANIRHLAEKHPKYIFGWPEACWSDTPTYYDESKWGQGVLHWTIGKWIIFFGDDRCLFDFPFVRLQIRKKIRTGQFSITILDEIVEHFLSILKEYLTLFVSTLDKLFRDKKDEVVAFATHGFRYSIWIAKTWFEYLNHSISRTLFDVEQFNKKVLLSKLVEYVCQNQIGSETATNALRILSEFNDKNPAQMQNYALQLMVSNTISKYRVRVRLNSAFCFAENARQSLRAQSGTISNDYEYSVFDRLSTSSNGRIAWPTKSHWYAPKEASG